HPLSLHVALPIYLCTVTFGLSQHAGNLTLGLGGHSAGIGVTFVYQAFAILAGLDGVVECCLHLFGRLNVLYGDRAYLYASLIAIGDLLGKALHAGGNFSTARIQD